MSPYVSYIVPGGNSKISYLGLILSTLVYHLYHQIKQDYFDERETTPRIGSVKFAYGDGPLYKFDYAYRHVHLP